MSASFTFLIFSPVSHTTAQNMCVLAVVYAVCLLIRNKSLCYPVKHGDPPLPTPTDAFVPVLVFVSMFSFLLSLNSSYLCDSSCIKASSDVVPDCIMLHRHFLFCLLSDFYFVFLHVLCWNIGNGIEIPFRLKNQTF